MSEGPLPHTVNTRKAVALEAHYKGSLSAAELPQLRDVLPADSPAPVAAEMRFHRDDEGRQRVSVALDATVTLVCQRCLEAFTSQVDSRSELAICRTDEEARALPASLEPLLAVEETDLWRVAEEELALALPVVAYHPDGECAVAKVPEEPQAPSDDGIAGDESSNPFDVLSDLLDDNGKGDGKV